MRLHVLIHTQTLLQLTFCIILIQSFNNSQLKIIFLSFKHSDDYEKLV
jgi:hypothetical protein